MAHAREEYLFQYSIYVLESSSTSSRLTYFFPPISESPPKPPQNPPKSPIFPHSLSAALQRNALVDLAIRLWQNLIALLFRPLRLILKAQTLRQFRIFILKATHAPIVGIIFAYESSRLFSAQPSHFPPATRSSVHISSASHGGSFSANLSRSTALNPALAPPTPQQSQHLFPGSAASAPSSADMTEMLTLMHKLSAQVEDLTARLAGRPENE